jgi:hypothetical protein
MPCSLTRSGVEFTAKNGSQVTVQVNANNGTRLVVAEYNGADIPVNNNSTVFTVVAGRHRLALSLAGPPDDVDIVEECGGGQTQHLYGYQNDFQPLVTLRIHGVVQ